MRYTLIQTETYHNWEAGLRDRKARALIAARLDRLAYGLMGDVRALGDGLSELRIHHGPGYRIYFKRRGNEIIILLCGGDKDSQPRDVRRARDLASVGDY